MMIISEEQLKSSDLSKIANLHIVSLPGSLLTEAGLKVTTWFYQFISESKDDFLYFKKSNEGKIQSVAVYSLKADSLNRRLFTAIFFKLLFSAKILTVVLGVVNKSVHKGKNANSPYAELSSIKLLKDTPELVLLFADESARGKGISTSLIDLAEKNLVKQGYNACQVTTRNEINNAAIAFYLKRGFAPLGSLSKNGGSYLLMKKSLT